MSKKRSWTKEEVGLLITAVHQFKGNQHWVHGQRLYVWGSIATELDRTVSSVYTKYRELQRKGITDFEE